MKNSPSGAAATVALLLTLASSLGFCYGTLQPGFYKGKCGTRDVEAIVKGIVTNRFLRDPTITPALLRMQFHDCFVRGCDASLLLDGQGSEKTAAPNLSVRGYDIIDQAKVAIENFCPGVVSCADIIVIATRDAVQLSLGGRYEVVTGRRDGFVSMASTVNLPSPSISVSKSIAAFAQKKLNTVDMVLLLGGGHTVGIAHCSLFKDRLYNFNNSGQPDPSMDADLAQMLRNRCPNNGVTDNTTNLDQGMFSALLVDNSYYNQILRKRGILQIDQALALDFSTSPIVKSLAFGSDFRTQFGKAMVNLGAVDVLTGNDGEIRRSCRATKSN